MPQKKPNKWLSHVKKVKAKYPSKSLKEVLQIASRSYHKGHQVGGTIADPLNFAKRSASIQRGGRFDFNEFKIPEGIAPRLQPYRAKGSGSLADRVKNVRASLGAFAKLTPEQLRQNRGSISF